MNKIEFANIEKLDYNLNEAYKTLRTNLSFCGDDIKVILLTSCTPNEGKSTIAMHLTQAFAENGEKAILLDADLRKSVLVGRYGVSGTDKIRGLSHYLSGQEKLDNVIYETNIENMYVCFAGRSTPNPTELINNQYFQDMINELRKDYDYVIVDAPPLGNVIDAAVLSKFCDGTIFVIENNAISYRFAQDVKKQLEMTDCKILGAILNKVDASNSGYYYRGYRRSYYRGYYRRYGRKYYGRKYYGGKYYGKKYYGNNPYVSAPYGNPGKTEEKK